eukprot:SAG25_NODE_1299_length_3357_cov_3.476673_2_plen_289_part_00
MHRDELAIITHIFSITPFDGDRPRTRPVLCRPLRAQFCECNLRGTIVVARWCDHRRRYRFVRGRLPWHVDGSDIGLQSTRRFNPWRRSRRVRLSDTIGLIQTTSNIHGIASDQYLSFKQQLAEIPPDDASFSAEHSRELNERRTAVHTGMLAAEAKRDAEHADTIRHKFSTGLQVCYSTPVYISPIDTPTQHNWNDLFSSREQPAHICGSGHNVFARKHTLCTIVDIAYTEVFPSPTQHVSVYFSVMIMAVFGAGDQHFGTCRPLFTFQHYSAMTQHYMYHPVYSIVQ